MSVDFYTQRITHLTAEQKIQKKKLSAVISRRILAFIVFVAIVSVAIYLNNFEILFGLVIPLVAFGFLLKKHQKEKLLLTLIDKKIELNNQELQGFENDYSSFESGKEFIDSNHPFSHDIDLFGNRSLFQSLNRTSGIASNKQFAQFISTFTTDKNEIIKRQEACEEMSSKSNWREHFRSLGLVFQSNQEEISNITNWNSDEIPVFANKPLWKAILTLVPVLSTSLLVLFVLGIISTFIFLIGIAIPIGIVAKHLKTIGAQHSKISRFLPVLQQHSKLSGWIEEEEFTSPRLIDIQNKLTSSEAVASQEINKLAKITQQIDNRSNPVFAIFMNALFLWDLQYLYQLKQWLILNQHNTNQWFTAVCEMETYASLGTFKFNHPSFTFPVLTENEMIKATDLAHPLLPEKNRVASDITINNLQEFMIITGANMAGKSTFLRAVATNLVLASSGCPTCSTSFSYCPTPLFTSMRTSDSLSDNESYFYSELKRLQVIVDKLKKGEKLFIILDEILKGTNSKDKAEGSKKFVKQLLNYEAAGIIATHDLSLCSLKNEFPIQVQTHYFDVEIEKDELVFDYKLKPGICSNMNAEFLMKKMGITE